MAETSLNIVMLCRDRQRLLAQSVESLLAHTRHPFTLTLVDDESAPITRCWMEEAREDIGERCQVIHNAKSKGTGAARNQGILRARERFGEDNLLYLSDSDVYFKLGWDRALVAAYSEYGDRCPIIGGWNHPFNQPIPDQVPVHVYPGPGMSYDLAAYHAVAGPSWLLSWETWDRYGELRADGLGVRQSEDWEYCQRIRNDGRQVGVMTPHVVLHTGLTDSFGEPALGSEIYAKEIPEGVIAQ